MRRMELYDTHRRLIREALVDCIATRGSFLAQMAQTTLQDIQDLVVAGWFEAVYVDLTPITVDEFLRAGVGAIANLFFRFTPDGLLKAAARCS